MTETVAPPAAAGYLTKERQMLRDMAREFTTKEVLPVANELDPVQGLIPDSASSFLRSMAAPGSVLSSTAWCRRSWREDG